MNSLKHPLTQTHFSPLFHFYKSWKLQKTFDFLTFSGFIEMNGVKWVNQLTTSVLRHIETSQLISRANQLTGFYMMGNTGR